MRLGVGGFCALAVSLLAGFCPLAIAVDPTALEPPALLTNLFQLRRCSEQRPFVQHPFRILADVLDADSASGVLALRDASGADFVRLNLAGQRVEPGEKICLEGTGCGVKPEGFGLAVIPGLIVDNDGIHSMRVESSTEFLHTGIHPLTVQWFNGRGAFGLTVEYQGPELPRQQIPDSALSRTDINPVTGVSNYVPGLDYRCYEGGWDHLPDFSDLHPVTTGVVTNFDLNVRTTNEGVALEFKGFITIPRDGNYTFYVDSDDGSRLFVGEPSLKVLPAGNGPVSFGPEKALTNVPGRENGPWITIEGLVNFVGRRGNGGEMLMQVGGHKIRAEILANDNFVPHFPLGSKVQVSGIYKDRVAEDGSRVPGVLLVPSWKAVRSILIPDSRSGKTVGEGKTANPPAAGAGLPLSIVKDIKSLSSDLAGRQLPVSLRGVVTATLPQVPGAVLQDPTGGIFVYLQDVKKYESLRLGEYCQITGVTSPGLFSPAIVARQIVPIGPGQYPTPLAATPNQLMDGSLDDQYAELEGVVTAVQGLNLTLLTEAGEITLELSGFRPESLVGYENALVEIRGCFFSPFNQQTHQLEPGSPSVIDAVVDVLRAAPRDPFDAPQKSLGSLLRYDPEASPLRPVKVSGQVICGRAGKYYLTDGTNGICVVGTGIPRSIVSGDWVAAVGFLGLQGAEPELKGALMRKTGHGYLPAAIKLAPDRLLQAGNAGMLVKLEATLIDSWPDGSDELLGLQSEYLAFKARINRQGRSIDMPPAGSRLELTGVYAPLGSRDNDGISSGFELLLDSPSGMRVLATPSWWSLQRVMALAGILAALLVAVLVWVKLLHRQVQERGLQLETEIHKRQQTELERATEAERSRIARDLHDDLGSGLTEISLLANSGSEGFHDADWKSDRFQKIAEKARGLASGLDVIVWAIDPQRNTVQSFADYLECYAEELLSASNIVGRFKFPIECGAASLTGTVRHSLLLAVKEALNNVIRHSSAKEVELQMNPIDDHLEIVIADNGSGFDLQNVRLGNGLRNLHNRLSKLRGSCDIKSSPGNGTTVKLTVPLQQAPNHLERPESNPMR